MITLITGAPGSGKSAALVSLLFEDIKDRVIYVNGIPDLKIPHEVLEDPQNWHNAVPDGAVVVIDEVQRVWRPRGPGQKVPDHIAMLETHRHRGLDFYVITQGPNLVDSNVRALVGRHVHLREMGVMGRWWYEWPECADNCRTSWKNAPIKKRYRLNKKIFDKYKSASIHVKPIRSFPKVLILLLVAIIGCLYLAYRSYSNIFPAKPSLITPVDIKPSSSNQLTANNNHIDNQPTPQKEFSILQFEPRYNNRPETAPAYDDLRKVRVMPQIAGTLCNSKMECKCYSQQGTVLPIDSAVCAEYFKNPPFNPYAEERVAAKS